MRYPYKGLTPVEQLQLRPIAQFDPEIDPEVRKRAWRRLIGWSEYRNRRSVLAALASPLSNASSPLHDDSVAFVKVEWSENPLLRATIIYHLALCSPTESDAQRRILRRELGIFLSREEDELAEPVDWSPVNRWQQIINGLALSSSQQQIHWEEAPLLHQPEMFDYTRWVHENPDPQESACRLAEMITHRKWFSSTLGCRLAEAVVAHFNSGDVEIGRRLTDALTWRLQQDDRGGLCQGLLTHLMDNQGGGYWVPTTPPPSDRQSRDRLPDGFYRLADIVETTSTAGAPWSVLFRSDFREWSECYWVPLLGPKVLSYCPVSDERTAFLCHCRGMATDYQLRLPDGYDYDRLLGWTEPSEIALRGHLAEAVRIVLSIEDDELAAKMPLHPHTGGEAIDVVRSAIGEQHVPVIWLIEAVNGLSMNESRKLIKAWLARAKKERETVKNRQELANLGFNYDLTTGTGFDLLRSVLAQSSADVYEVLATAGFRPSAETIKDFGLKPLAKGGVAVPEAWFDLCLQDPGLKQEVALPSLLRYIERWDLQEKKKRQDSGSYPQDVTVYLDVFWRNHQAVLRPLLPELVEWSWKNSPQLRNWLIDQANKDQTDQDQDDQFEIWPQLISLAKDGWYDLDHAARGQAFRSYSRHDRLVLGRLERTTVIKWYLDETDWEMKKDRYDDFYLSSDAIIWLFESPEHRSLLIGWLQTNIKELRPSSVLELIEKLRLLDFSDSWKLRRFVHQQQEDPDLAERAFALVKRYPID